MSQSRYTRVCVESKNEDSCSGSFWLPMRDLHQQLFQTQYFVGICMNQFVKINVGMEARMEAKLELHVQKAMHIKCEEFRELRFRSQCYNLDQSIHKTNNRRGFLFCHEGEAPKSPKDVSVHESLQVLCHERICMGGSHGCLDSMQCM